MIPRVRQLWLANAALTLTVAIALGPINTADTPRYLNLARSLGGGLGFTIDETGEREPEGFRMPGYPAWLAATEGMAPGRTATATLIGQQFAMLLSLGFAWSAARQTMGDRRGSVLLALSALYPFTPAASCQLSPEAFTAPMISGAWLLLCKIDPLRGALAGVLIGSATYFRPNMLALAPVAALALMAGRERGRYRSGGALLAGTALVLLPWAVRNQMVFGTISPLPPAGASGRVLLVATWEARVPISSLVAYSATGRPDQNLIAAGIEEQIHRANSAIGVPSNTRVALEQYSQANNLSHR